MTTDIERELRVALRRQVDRVAVPPVPGLEARPAPPRWRRWLGGPNGTTLAIATVAVVAVAVTALAVPFLLRGNGSTLPPAQTSEAALSPAQWPVRGSLAGDKEFQARAREWFAANESSAAKLKPADFHIVYAGDIDNYRIVVATFLRTYDGPDSERSREFAMTHTAAGSSDLETDWVIHPGQPRLAESTDTRSFRSMAVVELADSRGVLVIAPPGTDRVDYSPTPRLRADGTITRSWTTLRDTRVEDGIFRFTAPDDAQPRIRAVADGRVVADARLQAYAVVDENAVPRLKALIQAGSGGKAVGRLATELKEFEYTIGRVIQRVEVVRTFGPDNDYWVQAVVYTVDGGAIEVFYSDDPRKQDRVDGQYRGGSPAPLVTRLVPASEAGEGIAVWLKMDQCHVVGWDPAGRAAAVELIVDGKSAGRAQTESQPISADFCAKRDDVFLPKMEVRLYDETGKRIWSGVPAYNPNGGELNEHENLDVPTTFGERVG